jgi:Transglycosylase SLT domain
MYRRTLRGLGSASTSSVQSLITSVANQLGVPASYALAVAKQESGFNQAAVGSSGEIGVFQLMPATAAGLNVDPTDLSQNVQGGVSLLASLYHRYGNWVQALEAYNAGPTAVDQGRVPSSSVGYAVNVMASAASYSGVNQPTALATVPATGITAAVDSTVDTLSADASAAVDSLSEDLSADGSSALPLDFGISPWVWVGLAVAGVGLWWYVSA